MLSYEKIAQILRTDKDNIRILEEKLGNLTGKKNVMDKIVEENNFTINNRLECLGIKPGIGAKKIYDALIKKIEVDNAAFHKVLDEPRATAPEDWDRVLKAAIQTVDPKKGFFLKKEKAVEFLKNEPPLKVIRALGYRNVDEMLQNENLFEVYSSMRFVEGSEWLNKVFFNQYQSLKPEDFEEREITTLALSQKWAKLAQEFIRKKHHNISHLKELGVIYVLPLSLEISGETLRNFLLILHYFSEVAFYSNLFKKFSQESPSATPGVAPRAGDDFASKFISLLRGDVIDTRLSSPASDKSQWMIIQRYLSKDDVHDWRLFEPHVNPEALHWEKAERLLIMTARRLDNLLGDLSFWQDLNWVGDYFKTDTGMDVLVSFNLVDTSMSLVQKKEMIKYLYHHQESLWNKIFIEYFGENKMEELIDENIIKGWIEV